ncbi:TPA: hypothetical protein HA278_01065 [Candidatus Woesearchaeota archaeon]|nr:hypothetical protein [archaeon]HIJ10622.1 hypothetical protein [Candidatus Woesearchaeota archaeon]
MMKTLLQKAVYTGAAALALSCLPPLEKDCKEDSDCPTLEATCVVGVCLGPFENDDAQTDATLADIGYSAESPDTRLEDTGIDSLIDARVPDVEMNAPDAANTDSAQDQFVLDVPIPDTYIDAIPYDVNVDVMLPDVGIADMERPDHAIPDVPDMGPRPCYENNFENEADLDEITQESGEWSVEDGSLHQTRGGERIAYFNTAPWDDIEYTIDIEIPARNGADRAGVITRYDSDTRSGYLISLAPEGNDMRVGLHLIERGNIGREIAGHTRQGEAGWQYDTPLALRVMNRGREMQVDLNGRMAFQGFNGAFVLGHVGVFSDGGSIYDNVRICPTEQ